MTTNTESYTEEIVYQWQKTWSQRSLKDLVDSCENDTVGLPYFLKYLPKDKPVLECGCGLGQWVVYLKSKGYQMKGVEIVPDCVEACKKFFPGTDVKVGDVRQLPYGDNEFGGYISIGVLEHMIEGPDQTIKECHRIMDKGGVAVITVPAYNTFMRIWYPFRKIFVKLFRNNRLIRKIMGKPPVDKGLEQFKPKLEEMEKQFQEEFWPSVGVDPEKGPLFIEYKCKRGLIKQRLEKYGFEVLEEVPIYHPYIFNDVFGTLFFKKHSNVLRPETVELNSAGKALKSIFNLISPHFFNYLYLYVARKK